VIAAPDAGLVDGQQVTVEAADLNGRGPTVIRQCAGPPRPDGIRCDTRVVRARAAVDGTLERMFSVRRAFVDDFDRRWNCRARPCWIEVVQRHERPLARTRLRFA
jgi:hypothetical protein